MDLPQAVQPAEGQPEAAAPPARITKIVQIDATQTANSEAVKACKEQDIVMHRANSQSDGVCLRLCLTNRMCSINPSRQVAKSVTSPLLGSEMGVVFVGF